MSFASELDAAHAAIARAIRECSLVPVRVDLVHHNEKICDRVVAEIKGSGYMVANVTFHRQNVYFEAGLAAGMGRPVIWTCRSDLLEAGHFDTRQYQLRRVVDRSRPVPAAEGSNARHDTGGPTGCVFG